MTILDLIYIGLAAAGTLYVLSEAEKQSEPASQEELIPIPVKDDHR